MGLSDARARGLYNISREQKYAPRVSPSTKCVHCAATIKPISGVNSKCIRQWRRLKSDAQG